MSGFFARSVLPVSVYFASERNYDDNTELVGTIVPFETEKQRNIKWQRLLK
jgi:hypothetical protein